jgi:hypothetical protein
VRAYTSTRKVVTCRLAVLYSSLFVCFQAVVKYAASGAPNPLQCVDISLVLIFRPGLPLCVFLFVWSLSPAGNVGVYHPHPFFYLFVVKGVKNLADKNGTGAVTGFEVLGQGW